MWDIFAASATAVSAMRLGRLDAETTANVSFIDGGGPSTNVVPEHCRLMAEARSLEDVKVEAVNVVNAASLAAERGIEWSEIANPRARDYTNRLTVRSGDVSLSGTTVGITSRPRLVSAFGEEIDIELAPHIGLFRYLDIPGQIGRVGTILGLANLNIASMAVSRSRPEGGAVMAVTVDSPVSPDVVHEIAAIDGFDKVWFVDLDAG